MSASERIILLLENDTADVFTFRRALSRLNFQGQVRVVSSVMEAISYLQHTGSYADPKYSPRPDLIVCDLKLCASTGTELLQWMRRQDEYRDIPVVMLSGSSLPTDIQKSRELGSRGFYLKTGDMDEVTARVREMLREHMATVEHKSVVLEPEG